jgi:hypothetical protein
VKLIFSEEAERDVEAIDAWWRENRRGFTDESMRQLRQIKGQPPSWWDIFWAFW